MFAMDKSIHSSNYKILISLLREKREASGITQQILAERLGESQALISKIETSERRLDVIELYEICAKLNISFVEFIQELNSKLR